MACPEVHLSSLEKPEDSTFTPEADVAQDEDKRDKSDSTSTFGAEDGDGSEDDNDIVWHYLEFETEMPSPAHLSQSAPNSRAEPPPQCPDLKKYTSPFLWSSARKRMMTGLSCLVTFIAAYNSGAYSPGVAQMASEWNVSRVAVLVGITTFTCGFAIAPMFLAPFSEINGRRPVFVVTGLLFVVFQIVCAVTPTFVGELVNRFLAGAMSSTFSTMVGGVVSDIFHAQDRNTPMTLFSAAALLGTGFGPLICGFIANRTTWRWIFYHQVILDGAVMIAVILFFKETRGSVLLSRKAKALNKWYESLEAAGYPGVMMPPSNTSSPEKKTAQRIRWKVLADEERSSIATMLRISLLRPFTMLVTEPVVFFFSLWVSFSWGVLYMTFASVPLIFERTYGFNIEQVGGIFAATCVASVLFAVVAIYQEDLGRKYLPASQVALLDSPEGRLYFACVESALLPIGCLWLCITGAYPGIHWIVPTLGLGCSTMGIFSIYLAVFNYLADSYHRYASSALAAQSFSRNMLAGAFPLFTTQMFNKMTFQGAGGFLGGVGFLLTTVPWVLLLYGPTIRARSKLAGEIVKT
ncbi:unnamed protein product [Zymoseptoria tritici ST99CH_3D1]|uniref:Major facilitator superfamily (MFS) profile domain-containing protein n=3 Tax=Zymoseptoria tritici TaxID=1047171 RepID=A0A1X7RRU2_ZYMT9|nr:unnamed protein product [Zymoseptoria tritici ST99CH_3D7]SMR51123.1 unnamed protein product [Zymoseptoria tritici ST99CH_1E4]SMR52060.1 unnamed protein product [Zymoseptoria tritici ST99CH_3D1]